MIDETSFSLLSETVRTQSTFLHNHLFAYLSVRIRRLPRHSEVWHRLDSVSARSRSLRHFSSSFSINGVLSLPFTFTLNCRLNLVGFNMTLDIYLFSRKPRGITYFIKYFSVLPKYVVLSLSISSQHILIILTFRVAVLIGGTICIFSITLNQT